MRLAPVTAVPGSALDFSSSDDYTGLTAGYTGISPGTVLDAAPIDGIDTAANVPNWIGSEVMYVLNTGATAIGVGRLVIIDKNCAISLLPTTVRTGQAVYVTLSAFSAGNVTPQGGWVLRRGIAPVTFSVAATVGPLYIGTAGNATPTLAAGVQILNAQTLIAAASAFTRQVQTQTASAILRVSRANGVFPGQAVSGAGIPGGTTITGISADGQFLTMSANATATATVTGTFTPTGFGIVHFDNAFVQGNIT